MVRMNPSRSLLVIGTSMALLGAQAQAADDADESACADVPTTWDAQQPEHMKAVASLRGNTLLDDYEGPQTIFAVAHTEHGRAVISLMRTLVPPGVRAQSRLCPFLRGIASDDNRFVSFGRGRSALKLRPARYDEKAASAECAMVEEFASAMWMRRKTNVLGRWTTNEELLASVRKNYVMDASEPSLQAEHAEEAQRGQARDRGNHLCDSLRGMERRIRTSTPRLVAAFHASMVGSDGNAESAEGIARLYIAQSEGNSDHRKWTLLLVSPTSRAVRIAHGDAILPIDPTSGAW